MPCHKNETKKEETEPEPNAQVPETNIYHRLLTLEFQRKEQLMKEKEEKMNRLISHAF